MVIVTSQKAAHTDTLTFGIPDRRRYHSPTVISKRNVTSFISRQEEEWQGGTLDT